MTIRVKLVTVNAIKPETGNPVIWLCSVTCQEKAHREGYHGQHRRRHKDAEIDPPT